MNSVLHWAKIRAICGSPSARVKLHFLAFHIGYLARYPPQALSAIMAQTIELNLDHVDMHGVQETFRTLEQGAEYDVQVRSVQPHPYALNGYRVHGTLTIQGDLGDFCCVSYGDADGRVEGNVGNFFGHSIQSGHLNVRGNAGASLGAMGGGGLISVYGSVGARAGIALQGADLVIRGGAGPLCGAGMFNGTIVIGGNAGHELGKGMRGGTIYLRGDAESTSPDIEEVRMREPDKLKIGLLMLKAGIKVTGKEFKVFKHAT